MAQFFIPSAIVRHDLALDMSLKKLSDMRTTQRITHRPANLLKTVLVYNMFKAAVAPPPPPMPLVDMEVDDDDDDDEPEDVAAEQSWFDRCIDNMLTEDSQESMDTPETSFCIDDDDDDDEEEEEFAYTNDAGGMALKRSPSFQSLRLLANPHQTLPMMDGACLAIANADSSSSARPLVVAAAEDTAPATWQKSGLWPARDPQTTIHAKLY